jgi:hypothetical protein
VVEKSNHEGRAELFATVALSRLIHPTSIGERYGAKVFHFGPPDSAILAIQPRGISPDVSLGRNARDWLSVEDGEELRKLMGCVPQTKPMHPRVHRAYWNHEYAMRSYSLDARWSVVISGLEALIDVEAGALEREVAGSSRILPKDVFSKSSYTSVRFARGVPWNDWLRLRNKVPGPLPLAS